MNPETVNDVLRTFGLGHVTLDEDGVCSEAFTEAAAEQLCAALRERGVECECSEDRRDQSMSFVQVFLDG